MRNAECSCVSWVWHWLLPGGHKRSVCDVLPPPHPRILNIAVVAFNQAASDSRYQGSFVAITLHAENAPRFEYGIKTPQKSLSTTWRTVQRSNAYNSKQANSVQPQQYLCSRHQMQLGYGI